MMLKRLGGLLCVLAQMTWAGYAPEVWQLPEGAHVAFMPLHDVAMVDISVVWDAGSRRDATPGLAYLTAHLLDQGSKDVSRAAIARGFESVGAQCSVAVDEDNALWHCRMLSDPRYWQPGVALWAQALSAPLFAKDAASEQKQRMALGLKSREQSPVAQAAWQFNQLLYGDHPYAFALIGNAASQQKLTGAMSAAFFKRFYQADHAWVVITGDIKRAQAQVIAKQLVASLPKGGGDWPKVAPVKPTQSATKHIVKPLSQTTWFWGVLAPSYVDPMWWPIRVGNQILGGGMQSRLFQSVRAEHGYAYHAGTSFSRPLDRGALRVVFQARDAVADRAKKVAKHTVWQFVNDGPTAKEVARAQAQIRGAFYGLMAQNGTRHGALVQGLSHGVLPSFWDTYLSNIAQIKARAIQKAYQALWRKDGLIEVSIGGH